MRTGAIVLAWFVLAAATGHVYRCPPCGLSCDERTFDGPGRCPVCGMTLEQVPETPDSPQPPLRDYAGVYTYRHGMSLTLVPKGDALVAVIDEAPYPVVRVKGDVFRNGVGQSVEFHRDAAGRVDGVYEGMDFFARRSGSVPPEAAALTVPRDPQLEPYRYRRPAAARDGLRAGDATDAEIRPAVLETLVRSVADESYPNVHGILLWRHGRLVFEEYFYGYDRDRPHQLRSATKSFVSALVGIAVDSGLVRGERQPIVELLPWPVASYANPDPRKSKITVGDLLSMRSGLACDDYDSESPGGERVLYDQPDWARFAMDLPMVADPGTSAHYCSAGVHLAGRLVEHATGEDLLTFARGRLFGPLGFENYRWPYRAVASNAGTFGQLYLRPRDLLKFGILYLRGGRWQGHQVISRAWVERSTEPMTRIGSRRYGYFWWHQRFDVPGPDGTVAVDTILASGNGGQKLYVVPSLDFVAVFTGGNYNSAVDSPPNFIMGDIVLPELLRSARAPKKR